MLITKSEEETYLYAKQVAEKIKNGGMVCLFGDLGSGKTTFTKGLAKALGLDHFSIKSPTYTYIREHEKNFYHLDLYRLEEVDTLLLNKIQELLEDKKNIIVIEWADRLNENLPKDRIDIHFEYIDETKRKIY